MPGYSEEPQVSTGGASLSLSGTEFSFAPHWTLAMGFNYRWDNGVSLNLNANHRGDAFSTTGASQAANAIKARTVVNSRVSYARDNWEVALFARAY